MSALGPTAFIAIVARYHEWQLMPLIISHAFRVRAVFRSLDSLARANQATSGREFSRFELIWINGTIFFY
jgi:hypothetical protein